MPRHPKVREIACLGNWGLRWSARRGQGLPSRSRGEACLVGEVGGHADVWGIKVVTVSSTLVSCLPEAGGWEAHGELGFPMPRCQAAV